MPKTRQKFTFENGKANITTHSFLFQVATHPSSESVEGGPPGHHSGPRLSATLPGHPERVGGAAPDAPRPAAVLAADAAAPVAAERGLPLPQHFCARVRPRKEEEKQRPV